MTPKLAEKLNEIGLSVAQSTPRLRTQIKAILKEAHPDITHGFQSKEQEARYLAAAEALELLNAMPKSGTGTAIQVLAETQGALVQAQSSLLRVIEEERRQASETEQQRAIDASESKANLAIDRNVHQKYTVLSFGSWGIAGIAAVIALLDKPLGGILEEILGGDAGRIHYAKIVLGLIGITGLILGLIAKQREVTKASYLKKIMTDLGIEYLFYRYDSIIFPNSYSYDDEAVLSVSSLADALGDHMRLRDRSVCEDTSEAIIKKLEQRHLILSTKTEGISPNYTLRRTLINKEYKSAYEEFSAPNRTIADRLLLPITRTMRRWPWQAR
jgi:hypothetical protein